MAASILPGSPFLIVHPGIFPAFLQARHQKDLVACINNRMNAFRDHCKAAGVAALINFAIAIPRFASNAEIIEVFDPEAISHRRSVPL